MLTKLTGYDGIVRDQVRNAKLRFFCTATPDFCPYTLLEFNFFGSGFTFHPAKMESSRQTGHIVLTNKLAHMKKVSKNCCDISANV